MEELSKRTPRPPNGRHFHKILEIPQNSVSDNETGPDSVTAAERAAFCAYTAIESILDRALLALIHDDKPATVTLVQKVLYAVVDQWKAELALKALPRNFNDMVFLLHMAQHFSLEWAAKHLDITSGELREVVDRQKNQSASV